MPEIEHTTLIEFSVCCNVCGGQLCAEYIAKDETVYVDSCPDCLAEALNDLRHELEQEAKNA